MVIHTPFAQRRSHQRLYGIAAGVALLVVLIGFSPSFYLKFLYHTPPPLTVLLVVHGIVMTSWFVLFVVQTQLIASGRILWHRRLGIFGALLALAVFLLGVSVAITGARLGHSPGPPPRMFMAIPLIDMVVFAILVGCGLSLRRRSDVHKRLMLLATISLLTAAIARIPDHPNIIMSFSLTVLFALACVTWDTVRQRRLHPAFGWGFALIALSWPFRLWLSGTAAWQAFAGWLVG